MGASVPLLSRLTLKYISNLNVYEWNTHIAWLIAFVELSLVSSYCMVVLSSNTKDLRLAKASLWRKNLKAGSKCVWVGVSEVNPPPVDNDVLEPAIQLGMLGNPPLGFVLVDSSFLVWGKGEARKTWFARRKLFKIKDPIPICANFSKTKTIERWATFCSSHNG